MVTYGSGFKARYAHPWPLPLQDISSDKGLLSVVISECWLINGLPMRFVGCVLSLLIGAF